MLAPIILYVFERILRVWRAQQKVVVKKVGGAGAAPMPALPLESLVPQLLPWWPWRGKQGPQAQPLPRARGQAGC